MCVVSRAYARSFRLRSPSPQTLRNMLLPDHLICAFLVVGPIGMQPLFELIGIVEAVFFRDAQELHELFDGQRHDARLATI